MVEYAKNAKMLVVWSVVKIGKSASYVEDHISLIRMVNAKNVILKADASNVIKMECAIDA